MIVKLHTQRLQSLEEVRAFLTGTLTLDFEVPARKDAYGWIEDSLRRLRYLQLGKADKGLVRDYLVKVSGFSRAQVTRLIGQYRKTGYVRDRRARPPANAFRRRYLAEDVALLAEIDALHGTLCGPTTRKLCERAYFRFNDQRYERLAQISNGGLYNLRHSAGYQRQRTHFDRTRPTPVSIGERRKPFPDNRPGFLRVDSVHQGDFDGIKGVYHINAVDEVTQMQVVVCVERISEQYLLPALEQLLESFPFTILGFHADNGSEYINHRVAGLLRKLHIELTKSRARQSNDNALVESKNGSVVRKHLGYAHIPQHFAAQVNAFTVGVLSPYLNYHRPCLFPEEVIDAKGKRRKRYPYANLMTPYEKLKTLPDAAGHLKPDITFEQLDDIALQHSDNEAARLLNEARARLFRAINKSHKPAA
jgi:transposase InsO family protein